MRSRSAIRPAPVEVWHAPAATAHPGPTEAFCERLLLDEEKVRADRFRVASARHQHVVGRGMARALLSAGRCCTHEIGFRVLDHGKPIVESPEVACRAFNVAHTHGLVVCGLGNRHQWLGVDVEWMDRRTDPDLARRYFAPAEIRQLDATKDEDEHRHLFLKLWTLKEAFIKAIGTGLYTPLDQFAFEDANSDQPRLVLKDPALARGRQWRFESFVPRAGFVAAVAVGVEDESEAAESPVKLTDFETWIAEQAGWASV
ncbi:4'-phosphopantetheinyl transferase family protein [Aporhodopirellula aestuarii]|uniref:4'-phosphopantetheinyl transferase superfamily protein n=1 Tax=Aporhodopirellula aestuarii TaxID=2950107 RepID=A0ABT0U7W2_9BACT|nr:4'-phosphopantetheinyl transferase superfamily protein [Aporhodopirellula aestuarii]MCM2373032.1 4'-phosphopantetheinyl transferase superfamily protein [Aporhodopirellula aestuarii]